MALAWNSIVEDVAAMRLVLDNLQADQAKKELKGAEDVLPRVARECFKWLLCPSQDNPTGKPGVENFPLNTSGAALGPEIERVCLDNELVIATWSPIHLRTKLKDLYWKGDKPAAKAADFWEDTLRYLYLPRLKDRGVIAQAIVKGAGTRDFFGTAYGEHDGKFDGFKLGDANVQFDDTLLLIDPEVAKAYEAKMAAQAAPAVQVPGAAGIASFPPEKNSPSANSLRETPTDPGLRKARAFYGSAEVNASTAKMRMVQLAEEVIGVLMSDPQATVKITVEIQAEFPHGASDQVKRAVSENAASLGFKIKNWE